MLYTVLSPFYLGLLLGLLVCLFVFLSIVFDIALFYMDVAEGVGGLVL